MIQKELQTEALKCKLCDPDAFNTHSELSYVHPKYKKNVMWEKVNPDDKKVQHIIKNLVMIPSK